MPINNLRSILYCLGWAFLLIPFTFFHRHLLSNYTTVAYGAIISAVLVGISITCHIKSKKEIGLTLTDLLLLGFSLYILLNTILIRPVPAPDIFWLRFLVILSVYISTRLLADRIKERFLFIIVVAGLLESAVILLQHYGLVERNHLLFTHTGTFPNPGPAAGFLACSFTVLIYLITHTKLHEIKKCLFACIPLFIYSLYLTDSRAGWLAGLAGSLWVCWHSDLNLVLSIKKILRKHLLYKLLFFFIILFITGFLYQYKKGSSDGRIFIWQNSMEMVRDKPLTGHGTGMFPTIYPYYQARYFAKNPGSEFSMVAGSPLNPFNEYISVLTSQGLIGFIFLIIILFVLFYTKTENKSQQQKAFLLAYCVFAFFSYPTEHFRLIILLPFFIAILPGKTMISSKSFGFLFIPVFFTGLLYSLMILNSYHRLEKHYETHTIIEDKIYERIKYDRSLLEQYYFLALQVMDVQQHSSILKEYVELYPSPQGLCELGKRYKEVDRFKQAEEYFTLAANINPALITPTYELFLLYQAEGNPEKMKSTGEKLLNQPLKKENTASLKMKAFVMSALADDISN